MLGIGYYEREIPGLKGARETTPRFATRLWNACRGNTHIQIPRWMVEDIYAKREAQARDYVVTVTRGAIGDKLGPEIKEDLDRRDPEGKPLRWRLMEGLKLIEEGVFPVVANIRIDINDTFNFMQIAEGNRFDVHPRQRSYYGGTRMADVAFVGVVTNLNHPRFRDLTPGLHTPSIEELATVANAVLSAQVHWEREGADPEKRALLLNHTELLDTLNWVQFGTQGTERPKRSS